MFAHIPSLLRSLADERSKAKTGNFLGNKKLTSITIASRLTPTPLQPNTFHIRTVKMFSRRDPHSPTTYLPTYLPTHPPTHPTNQQTDTLLLATNFAKKKKKTSSMLQVILKGFHHQKMFNRHDPHSSITYLPIHPPTQQTHYYWQNLFSISEILPKNKAPAYLCNRYIIVGRNISLLMKFCHKVK